LGWISQQGIFFYSGCVAGGVDDMYLEVIDKLEALSKLKENWERVYDQDPDSHFFISFSWLSSWLDGDTTRWFVLAAKTDAGASDYVAFFPLRMRAKISKDFSFHNELAMAGRGLSDYTGLLSLPEYEDQAIAAFAGHLKKLNWSRFNVDYMRASESRKAKFLSCFSSKNFEFKHIPSINKRDNINNDICPFITLPESFDEYLATLSSNTRQKIRRFMRMVENSDEFRITLPDADTVDRDIGILLDFWRVKWGSRKGNRLNGILNTNREMLKRSFENDALFLPTLWKGERPLSTLGTFIDHRKKAMLFFIAGRDETFSEAPPPGLVLHGWSIRYAIENGFKTYDFLRGNEKYKYSFCSEEEVVKQIIVSTRNGKNLGDRLDPHSIPFFLRRATKMHEAGKLVEAERGYKQVLQSEPKLAAALYCYGQLMAAKGNHAAAAKTFKTLVGVRPNAPKAWLRLGKALEARKRFADAADAYREITKQRPNSRSAQRKLGETLLKLGRFDEATAAFNSALASKPGATPSAVQSMIQAAARD